MTLTNDCRLLKTFLPGLLTSQNKMRTADNTPMQLSRTPFSGCATVRHRICQTRVSLRTLYKYVKTKRSNLLVTPVRRGSTSILTADGEKHLVEWVIGMQLNGTPATHREFLFRASDIPFCLHGVVRALSDGWSHRFMQRHPELTKRHVQTISRARNGCTEVNLGVLFYTMAKLVTEYRLDASRIFNLDETSFLTRRQNTKVVALRRSRNVW